MWSYINVVQIVSLMIQQVCELTGPRDSGVSYDHLQVAGTSSHLQPGRTSAWAEVGNWYTAEGLSCLLLFMPNRPFKVQIQPRPDYWLLLAEPCRTSTTGLLACETPFTATGASTQAVYKTSGMIISCWDMTFKPLLWHTLLNLQCNFSCERHTLNIMKKKKH